MAKTKLPSAAQAKRLAQLWAGKRTMSFMTKGPRHSPEPYNDPTTLALIKYGWVLRSGKMENGREFANGTEWEVCTLADSGVDALEDFLREERYRRQHAAKMQAA